MSTFKNYSIFILALVLLAVSGCTSTYSGSGQYYNEPPRYDKYNGQYYRRYFSPGYGSRYYGPGYGSRFYGRDRYCR